MSNLTLYGHTIPAPVRSVRAFLKLNNLDYTFETIDLSTSAQFSESFTKINPYQSLPALVHNGFNLWESAAIITYLSQAFDLDSQWYPKDPKIRSRIDAILHWHHQNVCEPCLSYLNAKVYQPQYYGGEEITEEQEAPLKARFNEMLVDLKCTLQDTGYLGRGNCATVADVFVYNEVGLALGLFRLEEHLEIKKWFEEIGSVVEVRELVEEVNQFIEGVKSRE